MGEGHVFVSYSHNDDAYAEGLVDFLVERGFTVFWDRDIPRGSMWHATLMDRIKSAAAFIVVMTPAADSSPNVHNELGNALDVPELVVFPLLLDGSRFDRLSEYQYEDVTHGGYPADRFVDDLRRVVDGTITDPLQRVDTPTTQAPTTGGDTGVRMDPVDLSATPSQPVAFGAGDDMAKYLTTPEATRAAACVADARALAQQLRLPEALEKLNEALAVEPDFVPALINRASITGGQGDFAAALLDVDRAIALDPDQPLAHGSRAMALAAMKRLPEARSAVERAIALEPNSVANHWTLGGILLNLGEFALAEKAYDRALEISPHIRQLQLARKMAIARKWAARAGIGRKRR
jgi:Flp pilus assembly protein TadD